jgi:hypothetical protein
MPSPWFTLRNTPPCLAWASRIRYAEGPKDRCLRCMRSPTKDLLCGWCPRRTNEAVDERQPTPPLQMLLRRVGLGRMITRNQALRPLSQLGQTRHEIEALAASVEPHIAAEVVAAPLLPSAIAQRRYAPARCRRRTSVRRLPDLAARPV